jgi:hypothetical protein
MEAELHIVQERENKRRGLVGSIVVHSLILILVLIPFITFPIPPPGEQGILVSLGIPDIGAGDDRPEMQNEEKVQPTPPAAAQPVPEEEPEPEVKEVSAKVVEQNKEIITTETPEEIAIKKAEEEEAAREHEAEVQKQRELEEADRQAQLEAEAEAKKQADYDKSKKQFGDLLGGTGKGKTDTPGNQGDPNGDPDASVLEGISTGSGMIGGGLSNRGVLYEPKVKDTSQKTGRVVVNVCVDGSGKVISATYTQRGSTTTDSDLRALAERSARKFIFSKGDVDKQCGTVTIDFKLQ